MIVEHIPAEFLGDIGIFSRRNRHFYSYFLLALSSTVQYVARRRPDFARPPYSNAIFSTRLSLVPFDAASWQSGMDSLNLRR